MPIVSLNLSILGWKSNSHMKIEHLGETAHNGDGKQGDEQLRIKKRSINYISKDRNESTKKSSSSNGSPGSGSIDMRFTRDKSFSKSSTGVEKNTNPMKSRSTSVDKLEKSSHKASRTEIRRNPRAKNRPAERLQQTQTHKTPIRLTSIPLSIFNLSSKPTFPAVASPKQIAEWDASLTKPTALPQHLTDLKYKYKRTFAPISKWVVDPFDPIWLYNEVIVHNAEGEQITRTGFSTGEAWKMGDRVLGKYCCKPSALRTCVTIGLGR